MSNLAAEQNQAFTVDLRVDGFIRGVARANVEQPGTFVEADVNEMRQRLRPLFAMLEGEPDRVSKPANPEKWPSHRAAIPVTARALIARIEQWNHADWDDDVMTALDAVATVLGETLDFLRALEPVAATGESGRLRALVARAQEVNELPEDTETQEAVKYNRALGLIESLVEAYGVLVGVNTEGPGVTEHLRCNDCGAIDNDDTGICHAEDCLSGDLAVEVPRRVGAELEESEHIDVDGLVREVQYDLTGDQSRPMREVDEERLRARFKQLLSIFTDRDAWQEEAESILARALRAEQRLADYVRNSPPPSPREWTAAVVDRPKGFA